MSSVEPLCTLLKTLITHLSACPNCGFLQVLFVGTVVRLWCQMLPCASPRPEAGLTLEWRPGAGSVATETIPLPAIQVEGLPATQSVHSSLRQCVCVRASVLAPILDCPLVADTRLEVKVLCAVTERQIKGSFLRLASFSELKPVRSYLKDVFPGTVTTVISEARVWQ